MVMESLKVLKGKLGKVNEYFFSFVISALHNAIKGQIQLQQGNTYLYPILIKDPNVVVSKFYVDFFFIHYSLY